MSHSSRRTPRHDVTPEDRLRDAKMAIIALDALIHHASNDGERSGLAHLAETHVEPTADALVSIQLVGVRDAIEYVETMLAAGAGFRGVGRAD
jgi:hypothetical protein